MTRKYPCRGGASPRPSATQPWSGRRARPLRLAVHEDVDPLVVEAEQVRDLRDLGYRRRVGPDDVVETLAADRRRPVAGDALVRAARMGVGGLEQVHAHVLLRYVVADRQAGLEKEHRPARLGHDGSLDLDPDVSRAVHRIHARVRVAWMR